MAHRRKNLVIDKPDLWYAVGLITSDGSLSCDGRHINITSKDYGFLSDVRNILGVKNKIGIKNRDRVRLCYYIEFSNVNFYKFLLSIGLIPNKSLSLGHLDIPNDFFCDFLRGLIDGDGNIRRWIHSGNGGEQWSLRIWSGSRRFCEWLQHIIEHLLKAKGRIHLETRRFHLYTLKYGKVAAKAILEKCYYEGAFGLERKVRLAQDCIASPVGWTKSKTIICAGDN